MPQLDAFSAQIVKLVRAMSDEAILVLVRDQLHGGTRGPVPTTNGASSAHTAGGGRRRRTQVTSTGKGTGETIHDYVRANPGVRSQAARAALHLSTGAWNHAVKKLIAEGRIERRGIKRASTLKAT